MRKLLLTVVLVFVTATGFAQDAYKADAKKYVEVSGQAKIFELVTQDLVSSLPADKQQAFKKELTASLGDLMNKMAAVYMEEFTHDELKQMLAFYETPVGKKLSEKTVVLYQKGQQAGQEWGMGLQSIYMKYAQ